MERLNPEISRPTSPEEQGHVEFYQDWIKATFTEGLASLDELIALRYRFSLSEADERFFEYKEITNFEPFEAAVREIQAKIDEEVHYAAQDLRKNIFQTELFKVGIVIGDEVKQVEDITTKGEMVLPIIGGEPYEGGIDDVLFDR